jgi:hypothetical protein
MTSALVIAYLDSGDSGGSIGPLEVVIIALVWIVPAVLIAKYAERKGHSFVGFLLIGLLVSWIISGIAAVVVEDRRTPRQVVMAPTVSDPLDQLTKLTELREAGTLTDDEFEKEKARIIERRG